MPTIDGSGTMYSPSAVSRENQRVIFPFSMGDLRWVSSEDLSPEELSPTDLSPVDLFRRPSDLMV